VGVTVFVASGVAVAVLDPTAVGNFIGDGLRVGLGDAGTVGLDEGVVVVGGVSGFSSTDKSAISVALIDVPDVPGSLS
jgi:hypothetical protein